MDMTTAIIIVAIIVLIFWLAYSVRESQCREKRDREFMTGFWCASPTSCDAKGYRGAYLYLGAPNNDTSVSHAYIVALKGGRGVINRPFDFDTTRAWTNNGSICGKMLLDGQESDIAIDLDLLTGRMVWRDSFGNPLFEWEKNSRVTSTLF